MIDSTINNHIKIKYTPIHFKKCTKCKIIKSTIEFNKNSSAKDGFSNWCKKCYKEWHYNNREKLLTKKRKKYEDNKEEISKRKKRIKI